MDSPRGANVTAVRNRLCEIFPDACPNYLMDLARGRRMQDVDVLMDIILATDYPKREANPESPFKFLKGLLPDADPQYLRTLCDEHKDNPAQLRVVVDEHLWEGKQYPTVQEAQRKKQSSSQAAQYTTNFSVEEFVKLIPNPHEFFSGPTRSYHPTKRSFDLSRDDYNFSRWTLGNIFDTLPMVSIDREFAKHSYNFYAAAQKLKQKLNTTKKLKNKRKIKLIPKDEVTKCIPLLQEVAFIQNEEAIMTYIGEKKRRASDARNSAKELGLMKSCQCCFDDEIMAEEIVNCPKGCTFCRECVAKSIKVAFGEGKLQFPCLASCPTTFPVHTLQAALSPKLFSKVALKQAAAEIQSAGIEDLETCPFCDFAIIPPECDILFVCLNPDCMKQSCRKCKKLSHIPQRCEEVEEDEDVKLRTLYENKMTEALLKKCYKCGLKFFKGFGSPFFDFGCPFCDFAIIPPECDILFVCLNPYCMKQSCRKCKKLSHIPQRCEEVEEDEDVKLRTLYENKMTEALLKKCYKCGLKFFKEEGCNKMTCSCGAMMCYICGKPVENYKHFNGQGGDRYDLCPLWINNVELNEMNVRRGVEEARLETGNKRLKIDPTKDLEEHYKRRKVILDREIQQARQQVPQQRIIHVPPPQPQNPPRPVAQQLFLQAPVQLQQLPQAPVQQQLFLGLPPFRII